MSLFSLFSQSLAKQNYIFFDVETTGLHPLSGDKIIEIAMIKTSKGEIIDTIETMINPNCAIPKEVTNINNITNEMVKKAPKFDNKYGEKIINFIGDYTLVAHNAAFDLSFLSVELGRNGIVFERWKAIDTLQIAKEIFPGQKNKLESIMRRYNIMPEGDVHRALIDTDVLRKIFFEFLEESEIRSKSLDQLINYYGFQGQYLYSSIPAIIRESIIEKKSVNGKYRKRDGEILSLSFIPISPVWVDDKWFLIAKDHKTKKELVLYCENFLEINN
jgi:DNA polymerase III epsilon subunit